MTDDNEPTAYLAARLRDMAAHVNCHHYHRDTHLRMDKVLFDLCNISAHTIHLIDAPPDTSRDPPRLSLSDPEEPH